MDAPKIKPLNVDVMEATVNIDDLASRASSSPRPPEPFSKQTVISRSPSNTHKTRSGKLLPRGPVDLSPLYHNLLGPSFTHKLKPLATSISSTAGSLQYDKPQVPAEQNSARHRVPVKTSSVSNLRSRSVTSISQTLDEKHGKTFTSTALLRDESGLFNLQSLTKAARSPRARRASALLHTEMQDLVAAAENMDHYYGLNDDGHALAMKPINSLTWDVPTKKGTQGSAYAALVTLPGAMSEPCQYSESTSAKPRPPSARPPSAGRGRLASSRRASEVCLDTLESTAPAKRGACDLDATKETSSTAATKSNAAEQLPSGVSQSLARRSMPTTGKSSVSLVDKLLGKFRQLLTSS